MKDDPGHPGDEAAPDEHALQLTAWDAPSAIGAGERFRVAVGVRCPAGCNLGGRELGLFDQAGSRVATVKLGRDIWPGTEALYCAEVEAKAPLTAGSHRWQARIEGLRPHAVGSFPLVVRVVSAPECEVTLRVLDRESQDPIRGACVVMHPYRALTNESGIAKLRVAKGQYDILVSGSKYMPAAASVEVVADLVTSAELDADQPGEVIE